MHMRRWISRTVGVVAACLGVALLLVAAAWTLRPDLTQPPPEYPATQVEAAVAARLPVLNRADPPVVVVDVDYGRDAEGAPAWAPKGESPVLAKLVHEKVLPPVEERVGAEPLVMDAQSIGTYGGIWQDLVHSDSWAFAYATRRMANHGLVRWSPQGYPIVPNVAKSFEASDDFRTFTFHLRHGMRWSDGAPFTADDIMYWWQHEVLDPSVRREAVPPFMKVRGEVGTIEKLDAYTIRFRFPGPNGLFLPQLATSLGLRMTNAPAHYLRPYHPSLGDPQKIAAMAKAKGLSSPEMVYEHLKHATNSQHPRLWPWIYRTYTASGPYTFVRNPYYWAVDTQGNQLPYIDQLQYEVKSPRMIPAASVTGEYPFAGIGWNDYTLAVTEGPHRGYHLVHWFRADRSQYVIHPNINRYVEPLASGNIEKHRETKNKHDLLVQKEFRQALSLAIDRQSIIDAEDIGITEPAQAAPGPNSPFYEPSLYHAFTDFNPARANRMLDALGLTQRDWEGFRTFPDGTRMTFFLHFVHDHMKDVAQFVTDDWADVGVRVIPMMQGERLFQSEQAALKHDFDMWTGNNEYAPIVEGRAFVPLKPTAFWAIGYATWYRLGGMYGDPRAEQRGIEAPPPGHPVRRAFELYEKVGSTGDFQQQVALYREILKLAATHTWTIGISTVPPLISIVRDDFRNVPAMAVWTSDFQSPGNAYPERFYFDDPQVSPRAQAAIEQAIRQPTLPPEMSGMTVSSNEDTSDSINLADSAMGTLIRWVVGTIVLLILVLLAVRHPYIGRRMLIMVPTLAIISVIVFVIIQLPPEDFVSARIMELRMSGESASEQEIAELREMFHLDEPAAKQYARWMGLLWFTTLADHDRGLLQGDLGWSMEKQQKVSYVVGDRILLTMAISAGTILFTWALALPVGIFSAVRQYSFWDYVLTFVGFLGMCIPNFLLALVLMYWAQEWLGISISGLFSARFAAQPEWDWPKVADLLKHIWLPVVVIGTAGTAGMIRIMRANLLDELRKPYVVAARARGVRPTRLLIKYPVRLALNPFISGIGQLFPALVSGGAIVGIVLSLPTVGPLMLDALMMEDMYLAGSMLMVLSLLAVLGTLVSDLLLLWLDPRIRFQGAVR